MVVNSSSDTSSYSQSSNFEQEAMVIPDAIKSNASSDAMASKVQVAIQDREALIVETIRTSLKPFASKQSHEVVIGSELCEIGEANIEISLTRADSVRFAADATLKEALGANGSDETVAKVKNYLASKASLPKSGKYDVSIDGITLQLEAGLHFYEGNKA